MFLVNLIRHCEVLNAVIVQSIASKSLIVCIQYHFITALRYQETIIGERLYWIEVEYKYQIITLECQYLVGIAVPDFLHLGLLKTLHALDNAEHGLIEVTQIMIAEVLVIYQIPLATRILMAPSIAFAREVYPFGMTKLIAHEVQVATIDGGCREQANHLVQGDASMYGVILVTFLEVPVHIGIYQTEDNGLVAH